MGVAEPGKWRFRARLQSALPRPARPGPGPEKTAPYVIFLKITYGTAAPGRFFLKKINFLTLTGHKTMYRLLAAFGRSPMVQRPFTFKKFGGPGAGAPGENFDFGHPQLSDKLQTCASHCNMLTWLAPFAHALPLCTKSCNAYSHAFANLCNLLHVGELVCVVLFCVGAIGCSFFVGFGVCVIWLCVLFFCLCFCCICVSVLCSAVLLLSLWLLSVRGCCL